MKRLALAALLLALPALAHDGDDARSSYLGSLVSPQTGGSCCSMLDCLETEWRSGPAGYEALTADGWVAVPAEVVIRNRPHPEGRAVLCWTPTRGVMCFVPGIEV